ncbi:MAG: hypothetical protein KAH26_10325 [Bacteroidales bacterium]|nr:hypothetical protein [Bacteroidales bacterium]
MDINGHINLLIGIDDTDNAESRGTGFHARQLAHALEASGHAKVNGITRHQLFVNSAIRYTSQNSSACINMLTDNIKETGKICEDYLVRYSAPGSDAGLCIAAYDEITEEIMDWGMRAKYEVLHMPGAYDIANRSGIYLQGFTGNHEGIIGAMAAIGLHATGNDGRFIWRKGRKELRDIEAGIFTAREIMNVLELDAISCLQGASPEQDDKIYINDWVRPILKDHKAVLITEKSEKQDEYEWKLTAKELIRTIS